MHHIQFYHRSIHFFVCAAVGTLMACSSASAQNDQPAFQTSTQLSLDEPITSQPFSKNPFQDPPGITLKETPQPPTKSEVLRKSPEEIAKEFADDTEGSLNQASDLFSRALKGDRGAQLTLASDYLSPIAIFIVVMVLASWVGGYLSGIVSSVVSRRVDLTLGRFAGKFTKIAVVLVALMAVLGPRVAAFASILAGLVFAIGMALQGTLGNFAAGIALLVFRPFKVGDYIIVDGESGVVEAIELFTTTINTLDNRHIIVPNDSVFGSKIENWSHNSELRVDVPVGVSYTANMSQTRQVLLNSLKDIEGAIPSRGAQVYLCELNSSSVDWSCRVWCPPADYLAVRERVMEAVKSGLDQNGISIPFPQLDLHVITAAQQQKRAA